MINTINITSFFDNNQSRYSICSHFIIQENRPSTNFTESGINSDFYGPVQTLFANSKYYIRYVLDNNWSKWSLASGF